MVTARKPNPPCQPVKRSEPMSICRDDLDVYPWPERKGAYMVRSESFGFFGHVEKVDGNRRKWVFSPSFQTAAASPHFPTRTAAVEALIVAHENRINSTTGALSG